MTFPEVQFVAAPEVGAEVLFDFNEDWNVSCRVLADGFSLGTPQVIGDPDGLGIQYGARTVSFSVEIVGPRSAALEHQARLARTFMLRRRGWLRVQLDALTTPVWLRTYTPTPGELEFDRIYIDRPRDTWQIKVSVAAEPFIRGERIDLWSGQLKDDPAATGSAPTQVMLPDVVGDAPAPLRIEAAFSNVRDEHDILLATSAVPDSYAAPIVWQIGTGDAWIGSGDLSSPVTDSNFSAGSYRRVTFASGTSMFTRLWGTAPSTPPVGRYRVFLRAARDNTNGTYQVRFGYRRLGADVFAGSPVVTLDYGNAGNITMLDMGEFDFPLPSTAADMDNVGGAPSIALQASRTSGGANLILDAIALVPVDVAAVTTLEAWEKSDILVSSFASMGPRAVAGESQVWDGDEEVTFRRVSGVSDAFSSAASRGRFPTVRPAVANLFTLFQQTRGVSSVTPSAPASGASTAVVSLSYQPRWLWLGDG